MPGLDVPQKMGEVYAGLYILLVSKIIRRLINKKATKAQKVNGFLLDKNSGVIRCSIQFENFNLPLKVEIIRYVGGALSSRQIYFHFKDLFQITET